MSVVALAIPLYREFANATWDYDRRIHGRIDLQRGTEQLLKRNDMRSYHEYITKDIYERSEETGDIISKGHQKRIQKKEEEGGDDDDKHKGGDDE